MSLKNGCSVRRASMFFSTVCLLNGADLFRDVNAYGTPRDAPATTNTARGSKLIDPGSQFVRHPLAVARQRGGPHATSVDV